MYRYRFTKAEIDAQYIRLLRRSDTYKMMEWVLDQGWDLTDSWAVAELGELFGDYGLQILEEHGELWGIKNEREVSEATNYFAKEVAGLYEDEYGVDDDDEQYDGDAMYWELENCFAACNLQGEDADIWEHMSHYYLISSLPDEDRDRVYDWIADRMGLVNRDHPLYHQVDISYLYDFD